MSAADTHESLRESAEELVKCAVEMGMEDAYALLRLTPREIRAKFEAAAARRRCAAELADMQAWLTGRYVLMALHAPKRYPRRPDGVRAQRRPMTDAQMKQVFISMAGRRKIDGDC